MGTYRCNGNADCRVTLDDKGAITEMSDGWVFTPNECTTSDQPDYEYLNCCCWLEKTTDAHGAVTYDGVNTFSRSKAVASDLSSVTGSATYKGGLVGVYVHHVSNPDGTHERATVGHFTAKVRLMATFSKMSDADDKGTITENILNTVSGTIDNFALSGGETPGWSLALSGDIETDAASGTAKGGMDNLVFIWVIQVFIC